MTFDDVGRVWREDVTGEFRRTRVEDLSTARDRAAKFDARARRLWWSGTVGAIVGVPWYVVAAFVGITRGYFVATLGFVIITIATATLAIQWRRLRGEAPDHTLPVGAALEAEVARLLAWEQYQYNYAWWFAGPLVVGWFLAVGGSFWLTGPVTPGRLGASIFVIVTSVFLVLYSRREARVKTRPLIEDLQSWLTDLEDSDLGGASDAY